MIKTIWFMLIFMLMVIFAGVFVYIDLKIYILENELIYYKNKPAEIKIKTKTVRILKTIPKIEVIYIDPRLEIKE